MAKTQSHKVLDRVPKWEIRWLVDRMHVSTTNEEVREEIERRARLVDFGPKLVRACGDYAVQVHEANNQTYMSILRGNIGAEDVLPQSESTTP